MSFAEPWLKYLESEGRIIDILLKGDRPKDMPNTEISITDTGTKVKQIYHHRQLRDYVGKIPDKIGIVPIDVESVEIGIDGGFTFYIDKSRTMRLRHRDTISGFRIEDKETFYKKARELEYNIVEFSQTDV